MNIKTCIKTLSATIFLCFAASQASAWGFNSYTSTPNIYGGYNYQGDGWSGTSSPNIYGGYNYNFYDW